MKKSKKKAYIILVSAVLVLGIVLGGTVAWLTAKTDSITNTFTVGDVNITLTETLGDGSDSTKDFSFVPGDEVSKDPKVAVTAGSEACYLFVKVQEENNTDLDSSDNVDKIINWTPEGTWTEYTPTSPPANTKFYYINVSASDASAGKTYSVLDGDKVTMSTKITKDMKATINTNTRPKLIFTAAAIQSDNIPTTGSGAVANAFDQLPESFRTNS